MLFSSPVFLFLFLPVTLGVCFALPQRLRNYWLLMTSLLFYGWGEPKFLPVMLISIAGNFLLALWIEDCRGSSKERLALTLAIALNVGLLVIFKYTDFIADGLNVVLRTLSLPQVALPAIALPIGISFFTFHALSYVIDIYRRDARALRNPFDMGLYIALFSQLVAGPIIRFHDIAPQLHARDVNRVMFARGVERFVIGLGKKVLIANTVAVPADLIFAIPADQMTPALAWFGVLCYTLQIYFDFSGYSDMAIGLGLMFGFRFLENFNYPYVSQSITEFWRRWHISLSTWFRDYLYIPLGGNRGAPWRTYRNLITVFFLCGLWHGASVNFILWGLYYGLFLVVERMGLARLLSNWPRPLRHAYLLLVVMIGWVFFRSDTVTGALGMLKVMSGFAGRSGVEHSLALYVDAEKSLAIVVGILGSGPILATVRLWLESNFVRSTAAISGVVEVVGLGGILLASVMLLAAGTYNPFIYFRF